MSKQIKKQTYKVSTTFYEFIEAESKEEAIEIFENTGPEDLTLDTDTLKATKFNSKFIPQ